MLLGMSELLAEMPGTLTIEGHTDDVPISTARFRSNWDLSAARASAVANALLFNPALDPQRLAVKGFADTRPRVANDSPQQRALNRRVEIIIDQSASDEDQAEQLRSLMGDQLQHEVETQRH
jgi:chemotaxis protein MotB